MQKMQSRAGKATVQQHMCFSRHTEADGRPWEQKAHSAADLNPDRLTRGITRDEYKVLKQEDDEEPPASSDDDDDSEGVAIDPFDDGNAKLTRDQVLKMKILR
jgi:hypothetical protein|tara:strand:+ start:86 stop:394 length:309 start_codon:yes stop_codon:yes gene_type:complete